MGLSTSQRRANIKKALSKVRASRGGTTGGVSGGASVKGYSSSGGGGGGSSSTSKTTAAAAPPKPSSTELMSVANKRGRSLGYGAVERVETKADGTKVYHYAKGQSYIFEKGYRSKEVITDSYGNPVDVTGKSEKEVSQIEQLKTKVTQVGAESRRLKRIKETGAKVGYTKIEQVGDELIFYKERSPEERKYYTGAAQVTDPVTGEKQIVAVPARGQEAAVKSYDELSEEERNQIMEENVKAISANPLSKIYIKNKVEAEQEKIENLKDNVIDVSAAAIGLVPEGKSFAKKIKPTIETTGEVVKEKSKIIGKNVVGTTKEIVSYVSGTPTGKTVGVVASKLSAFGQRIYPPIKSAAIAGYEKLDTALKGVTKYIPESWEKSLISTADKSPLSKSRTLKYLYPIPQIGENLPTATLKGGAGMIAETREKPTKMVLTTAAFFVGAPVASKVLSKLPAAGQKVVSYGIPVLYSGSIAVRAATSPSPSYTLGRITAGELAPMVAGGLGAAIIWPKVSTALTLAKAKPTFRQPYKLTKWDILTGQKKFYEEPQSAVYRMKSFTHAASKYMLPSEKAGFVKSGKLTYAYHVTSERLPDMTLLSKGTSEVAGFYVSPAASTYFLKLGASSYSLYGSGSFQGYGASAIVRQQVRGFHYIPKDYYSFKAQTYFMETKGKAGVAYIPKGFMKSESEAFLTAGSPSHLATIGYYTKIPSVSQTKGYTQIMRYGKPEYIQRVKKFKWSSPSTYMDKLTGRKAGQIKYFGFARKGEAVIIETRTLGGIEKYQVKASPAVAQDYNLSYTASYPAITSSELAGATAYSLSQLGRSSYSSRKRYISSYASSSYYPSSIPSSKGYSSGSSISSISSISSYGSYGGSSSYSSGGSSGYSGGSYGSYGGSSGYSGGSSGSSRPYIRTPQTRIPRFNFDSSFPRVKRRGKKVKPFGRQYRYTASIVPSQLGIYGAKPKISTGISRRPLLNKWRV